jgi:hypothetical protein
MSHLVDWLISLFLWLVLSTLAVVFTAGILLSAYILLLLPASTFRAPV